MVTGEFSLPPPPFLHSLHSTIILTPTHRPSAEEFMENLSTAANKLQETVPKVLEALKKA